MIDFYSIVSLHFRLVESLHALNLYFVYVQLAGVSV